MSLKPSGGTGRCICSTDYADCVSECRRLVFSDHLAGDQSLRIYLKSVDAPTLQVMSEPTLRSGAHTSLLGGVGGIGLGGRFDKLLEECGRLHGHVCPGQLLGVRMALLGCRLVGVGEPRGADRKKLIVWVEIDRCMTDAVSAVTGVSLGRRTLKYVDYGKVAATFLNTGTGEAVRVVALDSSRNLADARYGEMREKKARQMRAYTEASDEELFKVERVDVRCDEMDVPGRPKSRVICEVCSEGINDGREVTDDGRRTLCRSCAGGGYYNYPQCW